MGSGAFTRQLTSGRLETRRARGRTSHLRDVSAGRCFMSEWSIVPGHQTTLEVTPPSRCVRRGRDPGEEGERTRARIVGLAHGPQTSRTPNAGSLSVSLSLPATRASSGQRKAVAADARVPLHKSRPGADNAESLANSRATLLAHLGFARIQIQHIPVTVQRFSHRYRRLRRAAHQCRHGAVREGGF